VPDVRPALATFAAAACAVALAAGCGSSEHPLQLPVKPPDSSWMPGQGSLTLSPAYLAIAQRADLEGDRRAAAYQRTITLLEARKRAARRKAHDDALRRYREARARALAKYRAALRKAQLEKERQQRLLEARRREQERKMRELLKKLRVPAGQECQVPEVARQFDCVSGRLPLGKRH
jgi:hypothetical protein